MSINSVSIENFKSIKNISFNTKRINIFIGQPNTGKTNILEALALQSQNIFNFAYERNSSDSSSNSTISIQDIFTPALIRSKSIYDLFHNTNTRKDITITVYCDRTGKITIQYRKESNDIRFSIKPLGYYSSDELSFVVSLEGRVRVYGSIRTDTASKIFYYQFQPIKAFSNHPPIYLQVPHGENLVGILSAFPEFKKWTVDFLKNQGLTLMLKPMHNDIEIARDIDGALVSYPYFAISETLQRVIFYMAVMETHQNGILLLDELETNTFLFYTKFLAERIAMNRQNQYFITTHNPYLLMSLLEKTPKQEIAVFLCYTDDSLSTCIKSLSDEEITQVLDLNTDIFFNFNQFLP